MTEWIKLAYQGWIGLNGSGKYCILLILVLLYWWSRQRVHTEKEKSFRIYTTVMSLACICPVTAAFLMMYQTRFYHYPWVWSLVPVTIVIAWGMISWLTDLSEQQKLKGWQLGVLTLVCVAILALSGDLGRNERELSVQKEQLARTEGLLAELEESGEESICLWAPRAVLEQARIVDSDVTLVYGRNMWDKLLNGYAYDSYGPEEEALYKEMCLAEELSGFTKLELLETAAALGVSHLILPNYVDERHIANIVEALDSEICMIQGYYVFELQ